MRCHVERGYGNLTPYGTTLWVRVKRHAIHHGCIVYAQKIRGRLLQEFIASWKIGREHSTYCGRNLVCDQPVSQYSIGLRTYHFWHQDDVIDQVNTDYGILVSSTSYSGFYLSPVQLIAWTEDTYIGLTLRLLLVSWTLNIVKSFLSPSDENTARNSWRRV